MRDVATIFLEQNGTGTLVSPGSWLKLHSTHLSDHTSSPPACARADVGTSAGVGEVATTFTHDASTTLVRSAHESNGEKSVIRTQKLKSTLVSDLFFGKVKWKPKNNSREMKKRKKNTLQETDNQSHINTEKQRNKVAMAAFACVCGCA
jgi:hypothetical protein